MEPKYQTLPEFVVSPFHKGDTNMERDKKYENMYRNYIANNKIYLKCTTLIEDSYYYLIKVPSESNDGVIEYDVVIRFFTSDKEVKDSTNLKGYHVQFFSNCPSFTYKFAYIYLKEGYGIDVLYDKLDKSFRTTPPKDYDPMHSNINYDKSIYFACKYLSNNTYANLNKAVADRKKVPQSIFFQNISSFANMRIELLLYNEEKKLKNEVKKAKGSFESKQNAKNSYRDKVKAVTSTVRNQERRNMYIRPNQKVSPNKKTRATKTSFRRPTW